MAVMADARASARAQPTRAQDVQMRAFARRIDRTLRPRYTNRQVARLVQQPLRKRNLGRPLSYWQPGMVAIVAALLGPQIALSIWPSLPGSVLLSSLPILVVVEFILWPLVLLSVHRFALVRVESGGKEGIRMLTAPWCGSRSRFGQASAPSIGTTTPGDLLVAIYAPWAKQPSAFVHLTAEGRQAITSLARRAYQPGALPAPGRRVKQLATEFDQLCDQYRAQETGTPPPRPLRSSAQGSGDPWSQVVLDEETKAQLIALADHFARGTASASRGLLLHGPPGTGKTTIARALAGSVGCAFYSVSLPDLKQEWIGASAQRTKELWDKALAQPRAVIFVDECENMALARSGRSTDYFSEEIIQTFLAAWDGFEAQSTVWVVGATNRRDKIDPAILSRFGEEVEIGLPNANSRLEILTRELRRRGLDVGLPSLAVDLTQGMSGRDLATLAGRVVRGLSDGEPLTDDRLASLTGTWRKQGSVAVDDQARWDTLVLEPATLDELKVIAGMLQHAESLAARGLTIPRGILLFGPPGTGKTQIARTLANETGLRLLAASTAELKDRYTGGSGQQVQELFAKAREAAPSLLFLDEIDVIAPARGTYADPATQEIVGQLLQEMDGAKAAREHVFVIAATNRPDQLDPAVLSRLPTQLEIPLPDVDGRRRLLDVLLAGKPLGFAVGDVTPALAERSNGKSGRDLRNWVEAAERRAIARALEGGNPDDVRLRTEDFGGSPMATSAH